MSVGFLEKTVERKLAAILPAAVDGAVKFPKYDLDVIRKLELT
jgi:hypothetical protein